MWFASTGPRSDIAVHVRTPSPPAGKRGHPASNFMLFPRPYVVPAAVRPARGRCVVLGGSRRGAYSPLSGALLRGALGNRSGPAHIGRHVATYARVLPATAASVRHRLGSRSLASQSLQCVRRPLQSHTMRRATAPHVSKVRRCRIWQLYVPLAQSCL